MQNSLILAEFVRRERGYQFYAKTANAIRRLRAAYDQALTSVDLLLLPTTPMKAQPLPSADAPADVQIAAAWMNLGNTSPFDVSHHPAMSVHLRRAQAAERRPKLRRRVSSVRSGMA